MNAFCAAPEAERRLNQKPISRYEARPTPSQKKKRRRKLSARTSISIEKTKKGR
jgi:hypothetical protein